MKTNLLKKLNWPQQKAVTYEGSPLLILAGAGSGKTRALTYRAAYFILAKKIKPENILLVTFTNKAAGEMKERIKKLLISHLPRLTLPYAGTFHSFCARLLRIEGKHLGIPPSYLIYDEADQIDLVKQAMRELGINEKDFKPASLLATISSAKSELISPGEYFQYARGYWQKTAAEVYPVYQKLLKKYEALDFDDLLFETVKLFWQEPAILSQYQDRFRHLLVDEYQDTNQAQYELTKLLAQKRLNLTVVGDVSQSIYGWRGANFRNILNLKNDFPDLVTINLEQNYRSHQTILDAAYAVISHNTTHPVLKLWTEKDKGAKIALYQAKSEKDEAQFIIQSIQSSIIKHQSSYADFAVLYRTNAQSRVLEEAFLPAAIPYFLVGGTRFYERKEIKDCLAYLRLVANKKDLISYQRIKKIGKRRTANFFDLLDKLKEEKRDKYRTIELLEKILKATDYLSLFNPKDEKDSVRIENIKELKSVALEFPSLIDFLENVALVEEGYLPCSRLKGKKKNSVTLMTAHAAKGLEFKNVFMVGMEEGLFPHSRSLMEKEKLEEERRLAYVGMTRAKERLFLTYAWRRLYFGIRSNNQVSRFVTEIPQDLLELINHDY
jgi:DNA helicase-2/ATP-dependent DNA helicase PcrA